MKEFQTGKKYYGRHIGDHNAIINIEVIGRTEKSLTFIIDGEKQRKKIYVDHRGEEFIYPLGKYSMAPTIGAIDTVGHGGPRPGAGNKGHNRKADPRRHKIMISLNDEEYAAIIQAKAAEKKDSTAVREFALETARKVNEAM